MPVRSSFTAGEVLTAADLTDTFASKLDVTAYNPGKILQVVSTQKTDTFTTTTSGSFVDITGLSASITPSSTGSKILAFGHVTAGVSADVYVLLALVRDSTIIGAGATAGSRISGIAGRYLNTGATGGSVQDAIPYFFLDSPATTTAQTYKIQVRQNAAGTIAVNRSTGESDAASSMRLASSITLMEVAA